MKIILKQIEFKKILSNINKNDVSELTKMFKICQIFVI